MTLCVFQSTLPARGATHPAQHQDNDTQHFNPRSPHGERHTFRCWLLRLGIFQSTLPARGATRAAQHQQKCNLISIHAPRTGSDCSGKSAHLPCCDFNPRSPHGERRTRFICSLPTQTISIHAPRTGSDPCTKGGGADPAHFNPRSPHGERHGACAVADTIKRFQSTLPARGATGHWVLTASTKQFQSTLPARGAT